MWGCILGSLTFAALASLHSGGMAAWRSIRTPAPVEKDRALLTTSDGSFDGPGDRGVVAE